MDYQYTVIAPPSAPGSGATVTLWDSSIDYNRTATAGTITNGAAKYKRALVTIYSSHASGTGGFTLEWCATAGGTYRTVNGAGSGETVSATTLTHRDFDLIGPNMRIKYVNSSNVLTTWQVTIMLDPIERAPGV